MPIPSIKILLCDESPDRLAALLVELNACGFADVVCVDRVFDLWERVVRLNPDIVLIDVDSPGRDTLEQLTLIRDQQPRPVVLFTQDQKVQSIQAAIRSGVSAYVTAGISSDQVRPAIEVAMATFQRFQSLKNDPSAALVELDDRAAIDRAKHRVMTEHQLPEEQAYHLMRRVAMNRKRRVADVAREILGSRSPALPVPPNPTTPA